MFQNSSKNLSESLKSPDRKIVPVQVRPRAPYFPNPLSALAFAMCIRMWNTFVTQMVRKYMPCPVASITILIDVLTIKSCVFLFTRLIKKLLKSERQTSIYSRTNA